MYLTVIIDWHSYYIVGNTNSNTLQTDMVTRVIKSAVQTYSAPRIIYSNQGNPFTLNSYIDLIKNF
ncbi:hypothetical protein [Acetobacterium wieringae]|uniref:hypothetical protein n=1 Tax=Acetobacterium wieringae TaxID=52694 RepID=UPI003CC92210